MPAAAVIPAPLAYTTIVAVKRLVVGLNTILYTIYITTTTVIYYKTLYNTVNKSECLRHVCYCALYDSSWNVASTIYYTMYCYIIMCR